MGNEIVPFFRKFEKMMPILNGNLVRRTEDLRAAVLSIKTKGRDPREGGLNQSI